MTRTGEEREHPRRKKADRRRMTGNRIRTKGERRRKTRAGRRRNRERRWGVWEETLGRDPETPSQYLLSTPSHWEETV